MTSLDGTLQAFADTIIPGRKAAKTDLGNAIHPQAIAGVDPLPGAVEADALALYHHPLIGFDALEPAFLADLSARSLPQGGDFLSTCDFDERVGGAASPGSPSTTRRGSSGRPPPPSRSPRSAPPRSSANATAAKASGYRVMGLPGVAPHGYRDFSYRRKLARERTQRRATSR